MEKKSTKTHFSKGFYPRWPKQPFFRLIVFFLSSFLFSFMPSYAGNVFQAEDFSSQSGCTVANSQIGFTGTGYLDFGGNTSYGEWTNISSASVGTKLVDIYYANGSTVDRRAELTVNGVSQGNIAFAPTGSWTNWQKFSISVPLKAGNNTVRITANTSAGGPNLDKFEVEPGSDSGYRYLRLTALGGVSTYAVYVTELNWMVGSVAYPQTKTTSGSSNVQATQGQSSAWRAYDGVASLPAWQSETTTYPYSITVDLGAGNAITPTGIQIGVEWHERAMSSFKCEGSNDNSTWTTLHNASGLTSRNWTRDAFNSFNFTTSQDTQAPSAPSGLTASGITDESFNLKWNASTDNVGVASYEVFVGSASKGTTTSTSMNIADLACNTSYSVTVKAKDAAGNVSTASSASSTKTAACPTTNLLSNGEFNNGTTGWSSIFQGAAAGGGSFGVVADANMSGSNAGKLSITNGGTANWNVELFSLFNLQSGKTYEVTFKAKAAANRSASVIFQKGSDPYTHYWEQNINLTTTSQNFGPYTWTSNISDASTRLNFKVGGSNADILIDAVVVKEVTASTDTQAPTAPANLTSSNVTQNAFTLSWVASTDNVGVTSYELFAGSVSKGTTTSTSINISGLTCETTYGMTVRAKDAAGNVSTASAVRNVATSACTVSDYPNQNSMLGMNMTSIRAYSRERYFTNLAHNALGWLPADNIAPDFGNRLPASDLTAEKYLKPGKSGRLCLIWDLHPKALPAGDYVFTYEGSATVEFSEFSTTGITLVSSANGRLVINIPQLTSQVFLFFDVTNNSTTNPVKNIRFTELSNENSTEIFRKEFIDEYKSLKAIRFMDWMETNYSTLSRWEEYNTENTLMQSGGVNFKYMTALVNQLKADGWFCVPMLADDDYVRQMARYLRDNVRSDVTVYIELSNEVWNGGSFPADDQAAAKSRELGVANTGKTHEEAAAYYGYRSAQIEKMFKEEFAKATSKPKLINVVAWQAENHWVLRNWVFPYYRQIKGADAVPEAIAIAPYFGGGFGSNGNYPIVMNWSENKFFEQIFTGAHSSELAGTNSTTMEYAIEHMKSYKAMVDSYDIPLLLAYEGGQHISPVSDDAKSNQTVVNKFMAVNRNRQMYDAYIKYLDAWKEIGGDLFVTFASTGAWGRSGSWGWKEFPQETRAEAPKYDAILDWNKNNPVAPGATSFMKTANIEANEISSKNNVIIYPNPVSEGLITIKFDKTSDNKVIIYNLNGKVFLDEVIGEEVKTLNLEKLEPGMYFFKINGVSEKVIID